MKPAYLGIDIGTSGIRGCCIDDNATEITSASVATELAVSESGWCEQEPQIWWQGILNLIQQLTCNLDGYTIRSIAIDGTSGTVLLTDEMGTPLSPALMYNDQRALSQATEIAKIAPEDTAATGASSGLAKALYLYERHPQAAHLCHQADWISSKLTGTFGISDVNNSLKTGYDPLAMCWPEFIQKLGLPKSLLPQVVLPGTCTGLLEERVAAELGLSKNCEVIAGTTDSIAAFIATGAKEPGTAVTSLGSTLALKMITDKPVFSTEFGIYSHRLGDAWLVGGASNSGGSVLQQFFTNNTLSTLSSRLNTEHSSELNYYPLPDKGERFPINDPDLKPVMEPRPADDVDFLHALLEGIANIEKMGYEKLEALSATKLTEIITAGGGSANTQWTKIREHLIGVPVSQSKQTEACVGTALLARLGHIR